MKDERMRRSDAAVGSGRGLSRRQLLRGTAAGALGIALAGCTAPVATPTTAPAPTAGAASAVTPASGVAASPTAVRPKLGGAITTMFTTAQSTLEVHGASGGVAIGIGAAICYSD